MTPSQPDNTALVCLLGNNMSHNNKKLEPASVVIAFIFCFRGGSCIFCVQHRFTVAVLAALGARFSEWPRAHGHGPAAAHSPPRCCCRCAMAADACLLLDILRRRCFDGLTTTTLGAGGKAAHCPSGWLGVAAGPTDDRRRRRRCISELDKLRGGAEVTTTTVVYVLCTPDALLR